MSLFGAALGFVGSMVGANAQKKAAQDQANSIRYSADLTDKRLRELAKPSLDAATYALPQVKNLIDTQIMPTIGRTDPLIDAQHKTNLTNIDRSTKKAIASSALTWNRSGNIGKERGEKLDILRSSTDATNAENLSSAKLNTDYKTQRLGLALDSLNGLVSGGNTGLSLASRGAEDASQGAITAAGLNADATNNYFGDLGTLMGMPIGAYLDQLAQKQTPARTSGASSGSGQTRKPKILTGVSLNSPFRVG